MYYIIFRVSDCSIIMKNNEFSFTNKKKKIHGTVDIWWLYDDGGKYSSKM